MARSNAKRCRTSRASSANSAAVVPRGAGVGKLQGEVYLALLPYILGLGHSVGAPPSGWRVRGIGLGS
jgi:hypothetical protein